MSASRRERRRWSWWLACAVGWLLMCVAAWGLVTQVDLAAFVRWFGAGLLLHDAIAVPLVLLTGALLARVVGDSRTRDALCWGLWVVALVALVWWPSVVGAGAHPDNPSILPRPYGRNLLLVTAAVAAVVAVRYGAARRALRGGRVKR